MIGNVTRRRPASGARSGIVLLVMLSLLGLFAAIAMTFVVAAGQFRRGTVAASRAEQTGDPFEVLLQQALMQVVRGTNHPQSVIGPNNLLEDIYGNNETVTGVVMPPIGEDARNELYGTSTGWRMDTVNRPERMMLKLCVKSYGPDRKPGVGYVDDNLNGLIDDPTEGALANYGDDVPLGQIVADQRTLYDGAVPAVLDNIDNYYAGRVITFISGDCSGQSCYVVRSKYVHILPDGSSGGETILFVTPPENRPCPQPGDECVINGRPFNGTGYGSTPFTYDGTGAFAGRKSPFFSTSNQNGPNPSLRALDMPYFSEVDSSKGQYHLSGKVPLAMILNPTDFGYRKNFLSMPIVHADEDYDAADIQNLHLSQRIDHGSNGGIEIVPSFHRPDLVRHFGAVVMPALGDSPTNNWTKIPPSIRRRIILRPDPADHFETRVSGTNTQWFPGEHFIDVNGDGVFNPLVDKDADGDGKLAPAGIPSFANSSFDAMNVPFPMTVGTSTHLVYPNNWDVDNDNDGIRDSIWIDAGFPVTTTSDGRLIKPLISVMVMELDGRVNVNAHGSPGQYGVTLEATRTNITKTDSQNSTGEFVRDGGAQSQFPGQGPLPQSFLIHKVRASDKTTEDRCFVGPNAYFGMTSLNNNVIASNVGGRDPLISYGLFDKYRMTEQRWAVGYLQDDLAEKMGTNIGSWYKEKIEGGDGTTPVLPVIEPAFGQGFSVADVNIGALYASVGAVPRLGLTPLGKVGTHDFTPARVNMFRELLEGPLTYDDYSLGYSHKDVYDVLTDTSTSIIPVGRYGERHLARGANAYHPSMGVRPRAGRTFIPTNVGFSTKSFLIAPASGLNLTDTTKKIFGDLTATYPTSPINDQSADDNVPGDLTFGAYNYSRGNSNRSVYHRNFGDFASPGDMNSDGALGLDLAGWPTFLAMGGTEETIDEPTEINLNRRYFPKYQMNGSQVQGFAGTGVNDLSDIDAPYTPSEMEYLLRSRDSNIWAFSDRLWDVIRHSETLNDLVTTDSWDIPCPHVAPTPELAGALAELGLPVANPSVGDLLRARFYLSHGRFLNPQYQKGNMQAKQTYVAALATAAMRSYRWQAGFSGDDDLDVLMSRARNQTRLISADLAIGLKMDINAPFGNGIDDNGNGVIDEPAEESILRGVAVNAQFDNSGNFLSGLYFDGNRDGSIDLGTNSRPAVPERARQQLAKEMYCTMMLLIDQNYVMPLPNTALGTQEVMTNPPAPSGSFPAAPPMSRTASAAQWLTARRIAQWAVNVVDFRDRDSIMTWFEFDVDPFIDNDGDTFLNGEFRFRYPGEFSGPCNGTWDVDNDVTPRADAGTTPDNYDDTVQPWRGIVWGCEYPDLLLTETLAFHDRRTQNTDNDDGSMAALTGSFKLTECQADYGAWANTFKTTTTDMRSEPIDQTWDQIRIPQGSAFVELYATGNPNASEGLPRELYNQADRLVLSAVITQTVNNGTQTVHSPVWRLAITQGRVISRSNGTLIDLTQNNVAARLAQNPTTCSLDPADQAFSILPWENQQRSMSSDTSRQVMIERVVTFCSTPTSGYFTATAGLNLSGTVSGQNGAVFFPNTTSTAVPTLTVDLFFPAETHADTYNTPLTAAPGDYVVVGPHRESSSGFDDITTIGRVLSKGLTLTPSISDSNRPVTLTTKAYTNPEPMLSLYHEGNAYPGFLATSPDGSNEYPVYANQGYAGTPQYYGQTTSTLYPGGNTLQTPVMTYLSPATQTANLGVNGNYYVSPVPYNQIRPPLVIACESLTPNGAAMSPPQPEVGFNISEPTNNDRPTIYRSHGAATTLVSRTDAIAPTVLQPRDFLSTPDDTPWDGYIDNTSTVISNTQLDSLHEHTTLLYKAVFLQRLADPTQVWNAYSNPYITMDWMPFDLTVFNGEPWLDVDRLTDPAVYPAPNPPLLSKLDAGHLIEPNIRRRTGRNTFTPSARGRNATEPQVSDHQVRFGTRQRGAPRFPFKGNYSYLDLWRQCDWYQYDPTSDRTNNLEFDTRPPPTDPVSTSLDYTYITNNADGFSWSLVKVADRYNVGKYEYLDSAAQVTRNQQYFFALKFQDPLQHTLGYINQPYHYRLRLSTYRDRNQGGATGTPAYPSVTDDYQYEAGRAVSTPVTRPKSRDLSSAGVIQKDVTREALGWLMGWDFRGVDPNDTSAPVGSYYYDNQYLGMPWRPFNWLTINNRPFASAGELMLVPAVGPARLLHEYDMRRPTTAAAATLQPAGISTQVAPNEPNQWSGNHYLEAVPATGTVPGFAHRPPFGYLLNFFESTYATPQNPALQDNVTKPSYAGNFYRIFEFVHVPSRFSGTKTRHNHPTYNSPTPKGIAGVAEGMEHPSWPFTAPFNTISAYREPGRVNINTMPHFGVWNAVTNDFFPSWYTRNDSGVPQRSGSASNTTLPWNPSQTTSDNYSTLRATMTDGTPAGFRPSSLLNPFRSYLEGYGSVLTSTFSGGQFVSGTSGLYSQYNAASGPLLAVDSTLLRRRDLGNPAPTMATPGMEILETFDPLFTLNFPAPYTPPQLTAIMNGYSNYMFYTWGGDDLYGASDSWDSNSVDPGEQLMDGNNIYSWNLYSRNSDYRNSDRNPFFRYQLYAKLNNIVTTRSNVYAVWITLGYFEVERVDKTVEYMATQAEFSGDDIPTRYRFPDGYRLVRELGSDTGATTRHKIFAIYDRTIPVGFLRGENLNVDRGFLVRRIVN